jgi:thiol-disulfide isomerase/thioredoxin
MRKLFLLSALAGLALAGFSGGAAKADEKKEKKESSKLKPGDPAPAFKVSKWVQGKPVESFASGKVYVVEFWATWCGPCIMMMPHMGDIQAEYKDKGLTIIGYTKYDKNNTAGQVSAFVSKRGPKLGYTFAYGDDRTTYDAWMTAADQNGIPCSFVVDQKGKIAYIGHPMFLDEVLPKVFDGTWKADEGNKFVEQLNKEVEDVFGKLEGKDPAAGLKALEDFEKNRPGLAKIPFFVGPKLHLMIQAGKLPEANKLAISLIATAIAKDDSSTLGNVASMICASEKADKDLKTQALKAADGALKISGDKDVRALLTAAEAYYSVGEKDKAKTYSEKAVDAAPEKLKPRIEEMVKQYGYVKPVKM